MKISKKDFKKIGILAVALFAVGAIFGIIPIKTGSIWAERYTCVDSASECPSQVTMTSQDTSDSRYIGAVLGQPTCSLGKCAYSSCVSGCDEDVCYRVLCSKSVCGDGNCQVSIGETMDSCWYDCKPSPCSYNGQRCQSSSDCCLDMKCFGGECMKQVTSTVPGGVTTTLRTVTTTVKPTTTIDPCIGKDMSDKCVGSVLYNGATCRNGVVDYQKKQCGTSCETINGQPMCKEDPCSTLDCSDGDDCTLDKCYDGKCAFVQSDKTECKMSSDWTKYLKYVALAVGASLVLYMIYLIGKRRK